MNGLQNHGCKRVFLNSVIPKRNSPDNLAEVLTQEPRSKVLRESIPGGSNFEPDMTHMTPAEPALTTGKKWTPLVNNQRPQATMTRAPCSCRGSRVFIDKHCLRAACLRMTDDRTQIRTSKIGWFPLGSSGFKAVSTPKSAGFLLAPGVSIRFQPQNQLVSSWLQGFQYGFNPKISWFPLGSRGLKAVSTPKSAGFLLAPGVSIRFQPQNQLVSSWLQGSQSGFNPKISWFPLGSNGFNFFEPAASPLGPAIRLQIQARPRRRREGA